MWKVQQNAGQACLEGQKKKLAFRFIHISLDKARACQHDTESAVVVKEFKCDCLR